MAVLLPILAVLAGGGAGAGFFFMRHAKAAPNTADSSSAAAPAADASPEFPVHLDGFTVNLADPEETHFLRITIDLGLGHAPKGGSEKDAGIPTARVRDTILSVLTVEKGADLVTTEGKTQLKQTLVAALNDKVPELDVKNVYFTEFLVQR